MDLDKIKEKAEREIAKISSLPELEELGKRYLGKRGEIAGFFNSLKKLSLEERKSVGKNLNDLKILLLKKFEEKEELLKKVIENRGESEEDNLDILIDKEVREKMENGHLHPLTVVQREIEDIFSRLGFSIAQGPEIEDEWHNFDALNIPEDHPARDLWDTFWLKNPPKNEKLLLRTHTSPVQIRYMEKHKPPFRIIVPGRVFRHEATDSSHEAQFYQTEGLAVGTDISIANFKSTISQFLLEFFDKNLEIRFRPSFFPFTEPSFEIDLRRKGEKEWLEVMGAGMVHPNVFGSAKLNPNKWQGFAFGLGVDRFAMIKYGLKDIRQFYQNDLRLIKQF